MHLSTFRVSQLFERPQVRDIKAQVYRELSGLGLHERVKPGNQVAITAGSRGIANIQGITKACVDYFRALGAKPFLVAAMGSHGGATPEGQGRILDAYGLSETGCGCPVRLSMETEVLGHIADGSPIHFSKDALDADHVVVVGRVRPHPSIAGEFQSGLMKMMLVGLGKHEGALAYHRAMKQYSFDRIVQLAGPLVVDGGRILAGIAVVENACCETAVIKAILPSQLGSEEKHLLGVARLLMPHLPFEQADLLIIDEIGKDISGSGMDTNVIGRKYHNRRAAADEFPKVTRVLVRDLSSKTEGNATGLGKADFCLKRVVQRMDRRATMINMTTAGYSTIGMIPPNYATDREMIEAAIRSVRADPSSVRLLWIANTLNVSEVECSEAYWEEAQQRSDLTSLTAVRPLRFNDAGELPDSILVHRAATESDAGFIESGA